MKILGENGYKISLKTFIPDDCKKIIIACHGFGGDKESSAISLLANKLFNYNIGVLAFDFPGHGESEVNADKLTLTNCINDLKSVEKFVEQQYPNKPISIFSTSFGAYISLSRINKEIPKYFSIVLRAPAICMDEIFVNSLMREDMDSFKTRGFTILGFEREMKVPYSFYEELVSNKLFEIYDKNINMLILQGTEDDIAPITDTKNFVSQKNGNAILFEIEGADHKMKKDGKLDLAINRAVEYILNQNGGLK